MNGLAPLSYTTLRDWRGEMDVQPLTPFEVNALLLLDAVMRHPEESPSGSKKPVEDAPARPAWPTRKASASADGQQAS